MDVRLTIRQKLVFFSFVISALPLLLLLSFISLQIRTQTRRYMQEDLQAHLHRARSVMEQRGDQMQGIATTVADVISSFDGAEPAPPAGGRGGRAERAAARTRSAARAQLQAFLNTLPATWNVDFLVITDARGRVTFRVNRPEDVPDDFSQQALFRSAAGGKPANGLVRETPERLARAGLDVKANIRREESLAGGATPAAPGNAGLCIEASAPIFDGDKNLVGAVLVGELLNNNAGLVDEIRATTYGNKPDAGAVAIYLDDYAIASNFYTGEGRALGVRSPRVEGGVENWFGQSYVSAYEVLKDTGGAAVGKLEVAVKEYEYQQPENQFRRRVFQVTVLAILIFIAVAAWAAQRFTRPILEVAQAANRISLGELDTAAHATTGDEIELLSEAVERMRLSLRAAIDRLKKV